MSRRRPDSEHLADAREHLRVLSEHLARGSLDDTLIRDAVSHRLEVAIDAIGKIDKAVLHAAAPDDWPRIVGMRNILAHQYSDLDQEVLQNTIDNRLHVLIEFVDRLRRLVADPSSSSSRSAPDGAAAGHDSSSARDSSR